MGKRCVVGRCSSEPAQGYPLFGFPKDSNISRQWDKFVMGTRLDWALGEGTMYNEVCALHFTVDDMVNHFPWSRNFQKCLKLQRTAVPTLRKISDNHKMEMCRPGTLPEGKLFIFALFT